MKAMHQPERKKGVNGQGRVIVWGILGRYPFGGVTWQALHHLAALDRLGFDVWYVEDSDAQFSHPQTYQHTMDPTANVEYVVRQLDRIGLADRWAIRVPGSSKVLSSRSAPELKELYATADLVLNICGSQDLLPHHSAIGFLAYLETDPVAEQVRLASGDPRRRTDFDRYDALFTYGENLGQSDCLVPETGHKWISTRPAVCVDWWETGTAPRPVLTTVANWRHDGNDVRWQDQTWHWSKHLEFQRFIDLPRLAKLPIELALGGATEAEEDELLACGWTIVSSIADPDDYKAYIQRSAGEFTVAKEQYVAPRSGWFSDRSACYLAAGRPVVTQDTSFGKFVPTGNGLFAYSTVEEAAAAIDAIASNYEHHSAAAREIARDYFDAERLMRQMLEQVGLL
jgi:hypothetical protein